MVNRDTNASSTKKISDPAGYLEKSMNISKAGTSLLGGIPSSTEVSTSKKMQRWKIVSNAVEPGRLYGSLHLGKQFLLCK